MYWLRSNVVPSCEQLQFQVNKVRLDPLDHVASPDHKDQEASLVSPDHKDYRENLADLDLLASAERPDSVEMSESKARLDPAAKLDLLDRLDNRVNCSKFLAFAVPHRVETVLSR